MEKNKKTIKSHTVELPAVNSISQSFAVRDKQNGRNDALKIIGIVTMALDHIGLILYPQVMIFRVIGRIAFPIFAWYLVQGFIHTSSLKRYALRLGAFALISQVPYSIVTRDWTLNILFALLVGLLSLYLCEKKKYVSLGAVVLLSGIIPLDYSFYGILTIIVFYIVTEKKAALLSQAAVNIAGVYIYGPVQIFSLFGTALAVYFPENFPKVQLNKYFFYVFYPLHLAAIYGIGQLPYFAK